MLPQTSYHNLNQTQSKGNHWMLITHHDICPLILVQISNFIQAEIILQSALREKKMWVNLIEAFCFVFSVVQYWHSDSMIWLQLKGADFFFRPVEKKIIVTLKFLSSHIVCVLLAVG